MNLKRITKNYPGFSALEVNTTEQPSAIIIFLHGLGATGHDFENVPEQFQLSKKFAIKYIFPHAPLRPVTLNQGMIMPAWYDILGLSFTSKQDVNGIYAIAKTINALIEEYIALGISSQKIILGGFSQGGALALHCGLRFPQVLGGILALSTYLPIAQTISQEISTAATQTPIFLAHGSQDELLPINWARYSFDCLKSYGCNVKFNHYEMGHALCHKELNDIDEWVTEQWNKNNF